MMVFSNSKALKSVYDSLCMRFKNKDKACIIITKSEWEVIKPFLFDDVVSRIKDDNVFRIVRNLQPWPIPEYEEHEKR